MTVKNIIGLGQRMIFVINVMGRFIKLTEEKKMRVRATIEFDIPTEGGVAEAWEQPVLLDRVNDNLVWCLEQENYGIVEYQGLTVVKVEEVK